MNIALQAIYRSPAIFSAICLSFLLAACEESDRSKMEKAQAAQLAVMRAKIVAVKARCTSDYASVLAEAKAAYAIGDAKAALGRLYPCKDSPGGVENRAFFAQVVASVEAADKKRVAAEQIDADKAERLHLAAADKKTERALKAQRKTEGVAIGMSKQQVLDSAWGRPEHINTTTTVAGTREQWVYGTRNYLYFVDGVLTTIQN